MRFGPDGKWLYVVAGTGLPFRIDCLDLSRGRREPAFLVQPPDPAGIVARASFMPLPDGRSYAYTYFRLLSDLYVADGLR